MKSFKTVFGVILLGAIGSGFWELFLRDFLFYLGNIFIKTATFFYSGYVDHLYSEVGNGYSEILIFPCLLIFLLGYAGTLFLFFKLTKNENKSESDYIKKIILKLSIEKAKFLLVSILFIMNIFYADLILNSVSNYQACTGIERRLDIIRPYITEDKYNYLVSEYRLIDNKDKLESILTDINKITTKFKLDVKKVKLLGID
nr:hypothetical protein [Pseudopedobacter sp.]